jgi:hypothetical protein
MKKDLFIITSAQLNSIVQMANDMETMLGNGAEGDPDKIWKKHIKNVDTMLSRNGLSRKKAPPTAEAKEMPCPYCQDRGKCFLCS